MVSPGTEEFSALDSCAEVWAAQVVLPTGGFQVVSIKTRGSAACGFRAGATAVKAQTMSATKRPAGHRSWALVPKGMKELLRTALMSPFQGGSRCLLSGRRWGRF